jgi:glycerate dehydrogenase
MTKRIVFLDRSTIGPGAKMPTPDFDHDWQEYARCKPSQVGQRLAQAHIAITNKAPITAEILSKLPDLEMIAIAATGTNVVDLDACKSRGIVVSNIREYAKHSVPEHTFSLILALKRNLFEYRDQINTGAWQAADQFCFFNRPMHDLHGATLGIIGTGSIATTVGKLASAFGMTVLYHSLSGRKDSLYNLVDLKTLLSSSDIVSIHCPLTEQSKHLINPQSLSQMRPDALLINTARGPIVDLGAVAQALRNSALGGVGLDVLDQEPPETDSTAMALSALPNCIVTPHTAWASLEAMQILSNQLIENIEAFAAGAPKRTL